MDPAVLRWPDKSAQGDDESRKYLLAARCTAADSARAVQYFLAVLMT